MICGLYEVDGFRGLCMAFMYIHIVTGYIRFCVVFKVWVQGKPLW